MEGINKNWKQYYLIQSGDSLSKITKEFYGDAMAYTFIFEANREVIQDPNLIFVGQKIPIPKELHKRSANSFHTVNDYLQLVYRN